MDYTDRKFTQQYLKYTAAGYLGMKDYTRLESAGASKYTHVLMEVFFFLFEIRFLLITDFFFLEKICERKMKKTLTCFKEGGFFLHTRIPSFLRLHIFQIDRVGLKSTNIRFLVSVKK